MLAVALHGAVLTPPMCSSRPPPQVVLESKDASIQQQQAALEDARQGLRRQGEAFRELLKKALKE